MRADTAEPDSANTIPTVTVRGPVVIRVEPGKAFLSLTLSALEDAPGPAMSDVRGDNPVRLQAARQAAADRRHKAEGFAEGADAKLGPFVRFVEEGVDSGGSGQLRAVQRVAALSVSSRSASRPIGG